MNIIDAVKHMQNGEYITHPKWRNGSFYNFHLAYNHYYDCIDKIDIQRIGNLDCKDAVTFYEFDLEDILDDRWIIYNY